MQAFRFEIGRAVARASGILGVRTATSGMGASSSSSEAMAHYTASSGAGSGSMCFATQSNVAVEDEAGKSAGVRLRLDAVRLQVRRASWREEAQHDVRESGLHGGQGGLAGVDAGHEPQRKDSTIHVALLALDLPARRQEWPRAAISVHPSSTDSVLQQSMRVGVLMFRVVELCRSHLAGFL